MKCIPMDEYEVPILLMNYIAFVGRGDFVHNTTQPVSLSSPPPFALPLSASFCLHVHIARRNRRCEAESHAAATEFALSSSELLSQQSINPTAASTNKFPKEERLI